MPRFKALSFVLSLATLSATAFGQNANPASPGTLNYVEGQASIEGRPISSSSVGNTTLQAGQVLATANGKAEVLLTPGIFVRLGDNSTVQMVSPDLTHTEIRLDQGRANVEVDQIYPQNTILDRPEERTNSAPQEWSLRLRCQQLDRARLQWPSLRLPRSRSPDQRQARRAQR